MNLPLVILKNWIFIDNGETIVQFTVKSGT